MMAVPNLKKASASSTEQFAADLLYGAEAIAEFLFGDRTQRRRAYHLAATSQLPVFRLGSALCARRSVLMTWIANQEARASRAKLATTNEWSAQS